MAQDSLSISRVVFGPDGFAEVTNIGDTAVALDGYTLCQFPSYPALPDGQLEPGQSLQVTAEELGGLSNSGGEVGIYADPAYEDADAITAYVQWGSDEQKRAPVAAAAGIWPDQTRLDATNASELRSAGDAVSPADWQVVE